MVEVRELNALLGVDIDEKFHQVLAPRDDLLDYIDCQDSQVGDELGGFRFKGFIVWKVGYLIYDILEGGQALFPGLDGLYA